jgi:hypothetical protein
VVKVAIDGLFQTVGAGKARKIAGFRGSPLYFGPWLPYHDLDPATRCALKQKRAAMFSESVRKENR